MYLDGDKFSTEIVTQQPPKSCYLLKLLDALFLLVIKGM